MMGNGTVERRINVVGTTGTGKTTFARALATRLGVPCIEIDALFWKPGWGQSPDEELFAALDEKTAEPSWVLDGNYSRTRSITWPRAQAIVWLDYSFPRVFSQLLLRTISRAWTGNELWPGCRETFRGSFLSRNSILLWCLQTYWRRRRSYPRLMAAPEHAHLQFVRLTTPRQARAWLDALELG